jgi:hypothetical protein
MAHLWHIRFGFPKGRHGAVVLATGGDRERGARCARRWCDVDLDKRFVRIERSVSATASAGVVIKSTKAGKPRVVSLTTQAVERTKRRPSAMAAENEAFGNPWRSYTYKIRLTRGQGNCEHKGGSFPGREIPKEFREVAIELVRNQGWRYELPKGNGYPRLLPPDKTKGMVIIPKTPATNKRGFENWVSEVRRRGGVWLAPRKG